MSDESKLVSEEVQARTILFRQNEPATTAFLVETGTVRLTRKVFREDFVLEEVGGGSLIGELTFVDGGIHVATAMMRLTGRVLRVERDAMEAILVANPAAARRIIAKLGLRLSVAHYRMAALTLTDVKARLMLQLQHEVSRAGDYGHDGFIPLPFDLPEIIAAERGLIVKALDALVAFGVIDIDGAGCFQISDRMAFDRYLAYLELKCRCEAE
jgi:CRP-like cAMP-binding protein